MGGSIRGGGQAPQISAEQAKKEWQAVPDYAKRATGAPQGFQQYGSPERYRLAGVTPGWTHPTLNPRTQMKELEAVEAAKRQERANRLNPPIIPPTRGAPISVSSGGSVTVPSGAFSPSAVTVPSGAFSPSTQGFRVPSPTGIIWSGPPQINAQPAGLATSPLGLSIIDNPEGAYMDPSGQLRIPTPEQQEQWALVRQRARDARTANPYQPSMLPPTGPIPIADSGPPQPAGLTVRRGTTPPPRDQFGMPIRTFTPEQLDQQALTRQRMRDQMTELGTNPFLPKGSGNRTREPYTPNLEDQARNVETFQGAIGEGLTPEAAQARVEAAQNPYQEPQTGSGYFAPKGTGTGGSGFGPKGTGFSPKGSGGGWKASAPSMQNALTATGSQNQLPITPLQSDPQSLGSRRAFSIRDQFINSFL